MLRTVLWLLAAVVIVILLLPLLIVFKIISLFKPDGQLPGAMAWLIGWLIPLMVKLAGVRFEVSGQENLPGRNAAGSASGASAPAMYVGNHQGMFDAVVPLLYLGSLKSIVMKKEIEKLPLAGWVVRFFGCIFLDRKDLKAQLACLKEMEAKLKAGSDMAVFPEGTRSQGPDMGEFKAGAFRAAIAAQVPVVPFAIDGSWRCYEEHGRLTPGTIRLSILPPIPTTGLTTKDAKAFAPQVQNTIQQELTRLRAEKGHSNA